MSMLWGAARLGLQSMSSVVLRGRQPQRCTDGSIDLLLYKLLSLSFGEATLIIPISGLWIRITWYRIHMRWSNT